MATPNNPPHIINSESSALQAHLSIMQNVIQRMASNSASCKTWCITIVSAILVVVADKDNNSNYAWIALLPTLIFAFLDTCYLALEKGFRNSYNEFVTKLHTGNLTVQELYIVKKKEGFALLIFKSIQSFSIWGFYFPLIVLIILTKIIAID
ncbi:MAG: hypothetical protein ACRCU2_04480 [Planktothrix sp.]